MPDAPSASAELDRVRRRSPRTRHPTGARAGLAGPRRPRRGRVRGARRRVHAPMGRSRSRGAPSHVGGGGPPGRGHPRTATASSGAAVATACSPARSSPSSPGRMGPYDALVEIWNGVPWFSPVWCRRPRVTMFHHVHGPMWDQVMPGPLAPAGRFLEARLAPPFYRRGLTVTPSDATREELHRTGLPPRAGAGVPERRRPAFSARAASRRPHPSIVAVGRLAPVKRFDRVIDAAVEARRRVPDLELDDRRRRPARTTNCRDQVIDARSGATGSDSSGRVDARRTHRPLPTVVARRQRVDRRGLGPQPDRGCGLRDAVRGDRHPRSPQQRGRRGLRRPRLARRCSATTIADVLDRPRRACDRLRDGALDRAARSPGTRRPSG